MKQKSVNLANEELQNNNAKQNYLSLFDNTPSDKESAEPIEIGYVTFFPSTVPQVDDKRPEEQISKKSDDRYQEPNDRKGDSSPFQQLAQQNIEFKRKENHSQITTHKTKPQKLYDLNKSNEGANQNSNNIAILKISNQKSVPQNVTFANGSKDQRSTSQNSDAIQFLQVTDQSKKVKLRVTNKVVKTIESDKGESHCDQKNTQLIVTSQNISSDSFNNPKSLKTDISAEMAISQLSNNSKTTLKNKLTQNHDVKAIDTSQLQNLELQSKQSVQQKQVNRRVSNRNQDSPIAHDKSISQNSLDKDVEKITKSILNSNEQFYFRGKTTISDSTGSNSANLKLVQSNDPKSFLFNINEQKSRNPSHEPIDSHKVMQNINNQDENQIKNKPYTTAGTIDAKQMRIKRNLNIPRQGTTEQQQMRSSKYQSMKEGTKQQSLVSNKHDVGKNRQQQETEQHQMQKVNHTSNDEKVIISPKSRKQSVPNQNSNAVAAQSQFQNASRFPLSQEQYARYQSDSILSQELIQNQLIEQNEEQQNLTEKESVDATLPQNMTFYNQQFSAKQPQKQIQNQANRKIKRYYENQNNSLKPHTQLTHHMDENDQKSINLSSVIQRHFPSNMTSLDDNTELFLNAQEKYQASESKNFDYKTRFASPVNRKNETEIREKKQIDFSDLKIPSTIKQSEYIMSRNQMLTEGIPQQNYQNQKIQQLIQTPTSGNYRGSLFQGNIQLQKNQSTSSRVSNQYNIRQYQVDQTIQTYNKEQLQSMVAKGSFKQASKQTQRTFVPTEEKNYIDWLNTNSKEGQNDFSHVTPHQASMIQKYSAPGSSGLIESKYYLSPRAQFGTPLTPTSILSMGLKGHNDRQIMSPPEISSQNAIVAGKLHHFAVVDDRSDLNFDQQSFQSNLEGYNTIIQRRDSQNLSNPRRKTPIVKQKQVIFTQQNQCRSNAKQVGAMLPDCFLSSLATNQGRNAQRAEFRPINSNEEQILMDQSSLHQANQSRNSRQSYGRPMVMSPPHMNVNEDVDNMNMMGSPVKQQLKKVHNNQNSSEV